MQCAGGKKTYKILTRRDHLVRCKLLNGLSRPKNGVQSSTSVNKATRILYKSGLHTTYRLAYSGNESMDTSLSISSRGDRPSASIGETQLAYAR